MRMPELSVPELSRRQSIALAAVVAGLVVVALALFGGSGSDGGSAEASRPGDLIEPVPPIDADDPDARNLEDLKNGDNPLNSLADPFGTSYGGNFEHKITIRVSSDAPLQYGVRFRDGHEFKKIVTGGDTYTRTVKGGFPLVQAGMYMAPNGTRGSCSITIDGVKVSSYSTTKGMHIIVCTA